MGALRHDNYQTCSSWIDWLPIDLNSRHPRIKEQDFLGLDKDTNSEHWNIISLSLVVNFVPEPLDRGRDYQCMRRRCLIGGTGRMLRLAHQFLSPGGLLFLAVSLPFCFTSPNAFTSYSQLPLPCVSNSRYITFELLEELMRHIGFHQIKERWKSGGRMAYWLYRKQSPTPSPINFLKKTVVRTGQRNNFVILLPVSIT